MSDAGCVVNQGSARCRGDHLLSRRWGSRRADPGRSRVSTGRAADVASRAVHPALARWDVVIGVGGRWSDPGHVIEVKSILEGLQTVVSDRRRGHPRGRGRSLEQEGHPAHPGVSEVRRPGAVLVDAIRLDAPAPQVTLRRTGCWWWRPATNCWPAEGARCCCWSGRSRCLGAHGLLGWDRRTRARVMSFAQAAHWRRRGAGSGTEARHRQQLLRRRVVLPHLLSARRRRNRAQGEDL